MAIDNRIDATKLPLESITRERETGVMIIKSITRGPWGEQPKTHTTWYQPFDTPDTIQPAVDFSQLEIVLVIVNFHPVDIGPLIPASEAP